MSKKHGKMTVAVVLFLTIPAGCADRAAPDATPESTKTLRSSSPLDEFFAETQPKDPIGHARRQMAEREQIVVSCMADSGFSYLPQDQNMTYSSSSDWDNSNDEEWIAEYGYGLSPEMEEAGGEVLEEEWVDVNAEYIESLSKEGRRAYFETLYGTQIPLTGSEPIEYDWRDEGCIGLADNEIWGELQSVSIDYAPLLEQISHLWESQNQSREFLELEKSWSNCMLESGYSYTAQTDARSSVEDRYSGLWSPEPNGLSADDPEPSDKKLEEARKFETEVAMADYQCMKEVDWIKVSDSLRFALEEDFISANKSKLEAYRQAIIENS